MHQSTYEIISISLAVQHVNNFAKRHAGVRRLGVQFEGVVETGFVEVALGGVARGVGAVHSLETSLAPVLSLSWTTNPLPFPSCRHGA